ncbi:MAG: nickel pincer cofactor biosynthesis protein LarC [Planctomycetota bacterium]
MRIAYLDCSSGISGDMTLGAMVDAGVPLDQLNEAIGSLGLPCVNLIAQEVKKHGFRATQVTVQHEPEDKHRHLHQIEAMIHGSRLTPSQKETAQRIFRRLAEVEAKVHGTTVEKVHFHEVGAVDSIADIVGAAVGWDLLGAERLIVSPIPTGTGRITIAHGECNLPAPATAELLRGIPLVASDVHAELTTPTGAAIVATLAQGFGPLPSMTLEKIGYGAGQRDLPQQANVLRLLIGETTDVAHAGDTTWVLETNLDDTTGEMIGHCITLLWNAGALDVYTTAIQMKKNRPGAKLSILCHAEKIVAMEAIVFRETGTLGIRRWSTARHVLPREIRQVATAWGPVDGKVGRLEDGSVHFAPEYESCRRLAAEHQLPLREVYRAAQQAFAGQKQGNLRDFGN